MNDDDAAPRHVVGYGDFAEKMEKAYGPEAGDDARRRLDLRDALERLGEMLPPTSPPAATTATPSCPRATWTT